MGNEHESRIRRPEYKKTNIFVYAILVAASWLASLIFRVKIVDKAERKAVKAIKGPVLALGLHHSAIDFLMMTRALAPKRLAFVIAANLFYDKRYSWAIKRMHNTIPKKQFTADFECVKSIKKMIENGISVGLYPEGRISVDGKPSYVGKSIAKLIKWLNVPVVMVKDKGAYLSMPRYNLKFRFGQIELSAKQILSKKDTETLSAEEIYAILEKEFKYNEFVHQQERHIAFSGKRPALGLDKLLYKCPNCGAEYRMEADYDVIVCKACGNSAKIDRYGRITAEEGGKAFPRIDLWYGYQKEELEKEIEASDDYTLSCEVGLAINDEKSGKFHNIERGILTLTKQGYAYQGETGRELKFVISGTPSVAFNVGVSIDFFFDNVIYRFCFDKVPMSTKFNIATELLHNKYYRETRKD